MKVAILKRLSISLFNNSYSIIHKIEEDVNHRIRVGGWSGEVHRNIVWSWILIRWWEIFLRDC